jgi:hypothetical protein
MDSVAPRFAPATNDRHLTGTVNALRPPVRIAQTGSVDEPASSTRGPSSASAKRAAGPRHRTTLDEPGQPPRPGARACSRDAPGAGHLALETRSDEAAARVRDFLQRHLQPAAPVPATEPPNGGCHRRRSAHSHAARTSASVRRASAASPAGDAGAFITRKLSRAVHPPQRP